jgi:hypothetical protein
MDGNKPRDVMERLPKKESGIAMLLGQRRLKMIGHMFGRAGKPQGELPGSHACLSANRPLHLEEAGNNGRGIIGADLIVIIAAFFTMSRNASTSPAGSAAAPFSVPSMRMSLPPCGGIDPLRQIHAPD